MNTLALVPAGVVVGLLVVALGAPALIGLAALLVIAVLARRIPMALVVGSAGLTSFIVLAWSALTCSGSPTACAIDGGLTVLLAATLLLGITGMLVALFAGPRAADPQT